jgi:aminoglycoside phosphotransferase (APT) family kinase protein
MGDRLPRERRDLYARLLDRAPRLIKRTDSRRGVTITHGDAHVWNSFLPRDGGNDVRLFDWDGWGLGVATKDLAYMTAVHWSSRSTPPLGAAAPRRLSLGPAHAGRQGLRPAGARLRLSTIDAVAHYDSGLASRREYPDRNLVEQSRANSYGNKGFGLRRVA